MSEKAARKEFESSKLLKKIMADHFYELDRAARDGNTKIAWCTSVGPAELLRAMGFLVYFPENHGAMLGSTRVAMDYIPVANAEGYSPDICSYLTSDIGAFLKKETPLQKVYNISEVPRPDVLIYNTNQCRDVKDWFAWYGRHFNVPCAGIVTHREVGAVDEHHVESVATQLKDLVPLLENTSGKRFDMDRLKEVVGLSRECTDLWKAVLDTASAVPAPINFFDATIHMGPAVVARGTVEAVNYYKILLSELKERVKNRIASVDGEKHRLYWDGMPVWGKLRNLSELFSQLKSCVVASTYCNSWIFTAFDSADPFESMARAYIELFIVRDEPYKEEYVKNCVDFFNVDGLIFHDAKTCPNNSNNRYGMPGRLEQKLNIPVLTINGDLNDLRCYSEEQVITNIEAFIEQLDERS
jgi:benzoyl-CoA reductase/2-hydroxyglutaryl-CoA dehydratase subunit BcrC/BadD/HgdB